MGRLPMAEPEEPWENQARNWFFQMAQHLSDGLTMLGYGKPGNLRPHRNLKTASNYMQKRFEGTSNYS